MGSPIGGGSAASHEIARAFAVAVMLCCACAQAGAVRQVVPADAAGVPALEASAPAPPAAPAPVRRVPVRITTLSNGLKLLSRTNDSSEIVSVVCIVRAGLPDERDEQAGLAALTAEALLGGTTTHPGNSFANAVARAGGNLGTLAGFDFTEITIVTGKEQFEPALKLIADVVAHPAFTPEMINTARESVKRRIAQLQDDFTGASYQSLTSSLYPSSPYGRPPNGYVQTLDRLTAADVRQFWQTNYVQNRMVVAVVGDVDSTRALNLAQKAFQDVPFRQGAATAAPEIPPLPRPKVELIQREGPAAQLMVGFLAPGATRQNYPVMALLDAVVGGGKRARLFSNIREKHSIGYAMGSFYQPLLFQSHFVGYVITPPSEPVRNQEPRPLIEKVKGLLIDQYRELAAAGPTPQELNRAKAYVMGKYALRQERTRDQAKWLAWNVAMGLDADFDEYFNQRVPTTTKEEVQAAAKAFLKNYALVVTVPTQDKDR